MAMKTDNFINGDIFEQGIKTVVTDKENICLALLDSSGNILAFTDKIGKGEHSVLSFKSNGDKGKGGGTLTIDTIDAARTKPNKKEKVPGLEGQGVQASRFLIAEWGSANFETGGSLLDPDGSYSFPTGDPQKQLICGALANGPFISEQTSFQFNKSTIEFSIS